MRKLRFCGVALLLVVSVTLSACGLPGFDQINQNNQEAEPEVVNYNPVGEWVAMSVNGLGWSIWQYFKLDEEHTIYYKNEMLRDGNIPVSGFLNSGYSCPNYTYYGQWATTEDTLTMMIYGEYYTYNIVTGIAGTSWDTFYVNRPTSEDMAFYQGVIFLGGEEHIQFLRINHSEANEPADSENEIL